MFLRQGGGRGREKELARTRVLAYILSEHACAKRGDGETKMRGDTLRGVRGDTLRGEGETKMRGDTLRGVRGDTLRGEGETKMRGDTKEAQRRKEIKQGNTVSGALCSLERKVIKIRGDALREKRLK
jgi:hypothetical protein